MRHLIRLLLVDDHLVARKGIMMMLQGAEDIQVVGEAESLRQAVDFLRIQQVDVALIDINLPDGSGLDLIRQLRESHTGLACVIISAYSEEMYAVRAYRNGAGAYLTKNVTPDILQEAIRKVAAGGRYVTAASSEKLLEALDGGGGALHTRLSDRELDVFKLLAAGHSLVQIGQSLHLSPSSVATYRTRILEKTGLKSNAQIARYVFENELLL